MSDSAMSWGNIRKRESKVSEDLVEKWLNESTLRNWARDTLTDVPNTKDYATSVTEFRNIPICDALKQKVSKLVYTMEYKMRFVPSQPMG